MAPRTLIWCGARGIPLYGPSGASAHLRGVARALRRRGHEVQIATVCAADDRGRWDDRDALPAIHLPTPGAAPRRWPTGIRTLGARIDGHLLAAAAWPIARPDLVWERHEPATRAADRWARWRGVPRLVELNAPLSLERRWPRSPRRAALERERAVLQGADRVVAVSAWLAEWAVREAGCRADRVLHVPNGIPQHAAGARTSARASLGLDGPVVGFVGSMRPWHGAEGLPALLDALGPPWEGPRRGRGRGLRRPPTPA